MSKEFKLLPDIFKTSGISKRDTVKQIIMKLESTKSQLYGKATRDPSLYNVIYDIDAVIRSLRDM